MNPPRPRAIAGGLALAFALAAPGARSQPPPDTALARQVHAEVNARQAAMRTAAFKAQRPGVAYGSEVRAWADAGGVRKIQVTDRDDSGDVVIEYYYAQGALVFAYRAIKGFEASGRAVTRVEDRQYFRDGRMFHWLGGMDKVAVPAGGADFAAESKERLAASAFYAREAARALPAAAPNVATPANANAAKSSGPSSFCTPLEDVVFSCRTGARQVSVCASKSIAPGAGYAQYRFGKPDPGESLELALPEGRVPASKAATGESVPFAGGGGAWMRFRQGDHAYVVYTGIGRWGPKGETRTKAGLVVERKGRAIANLRCAGEPASELGPDWFGRAGVAVGRDEDFLFPD